MAAGHRMSNLWKTITGDQLTSEVGEWRHIKAGEFIAPGCYSTGTPAGRSRLENPRKIIVIISVKVIIVVVLVIIIISIILIIQKYREFMTPGCSSSEVAGTLQGGRRIRNFFMRSFFAFYQIRTVQNTNFDIF